MMQDKYVPIQMSGPRAAGPNAVPAEREVIWKKVCKI